MTNENEFVEEFVVPGGKCSFVLTIRNDGTVDLTFTVSPWITPSSDLPHTANVTGTYTQTALETSRT